MAITFNSNNYIIRNSNITVPTLKQANNLQELQKNISSYTESVSTYINDNRKLTEQKDYVSDRFKKDLFIKTGLATFNAKTNKYTENIKANDAYETVATTDLPTSVSQINTITTNLEKIANTLLKFTQEDAQKGYPNVTAETYLTNSTDIDKTDITYDTKAIKITINGNDQFFYNTKPNQLETNRTFTSYNDSIEQNFILEYNSSTQKFLLKKDSSVVKSFQLDENNDPIVENADVNCKFIDKTSTAEATSYNTIQDAINNQVTNIVLCSNVTNPGLQLSNNLSITIDLGGNNITFENPMVGSTGTENQCMQFLKGTTVILKNGTITTNPNARFAIQNYCNLTLDNVKITISGEYTKPDGITKQSKYALSNNFGNVILRNGTQLHAIKSANSSEKQPVAFDLYYGMDPNGEYDSGVFVTIEDNVIIDGDIEYDKASRITDSDWRDRCVLRVHQNVSITPPTGYKFQVIEGTNYKKLVPIAE